MARLDLHSRLVTWAKVALPLAALAILSTLFLLADRIDPTAAIPYADGRCRRPCPRSAHDLAHLCGRHI